MKGTKNPFFSIETASPWFQQADDRWLVFPNQFFQIPKEFRGNSFSTVPRKNLHRGSELEAGISPSSVCISSESIWGLSCLSSGGLPGSSPTNWGDCSTSIECLSGGLDFKSGACCCKKLWAPGETFVAETVCKLFSILTAFGVCTVCMFCLAEGSAGHSMSWLIEPASKTAEAEMYGWVFSMLGFLIGLSQF